MLAPLDLLKNYIEKEIKILMRKEKMYQGILKGFDEHGNLFMTEAKEIMSEGCCIRIGTVIINGGTVAMIDIE